jgi:hypothetical protein
MRALPGQDRARRKNSSYMVGTTMRILAVCLIGIFLSTGCGWASRTAGKAQAKLERKADSVERTPDKIERSYDEGYNREKAKEKAKQPQQ